MKKLAILALVLILAISSVAAKPDEKNVKCEDLGYEMLTKFDFPADGTKDGVTLSWSDCSANECFTATWTSDTQVGLVLEKAGPATYQHIGGMSGVVYNSSKHALSHVELCKDETVTAQSVPEFGVLASIGILGAAGLYIYRRRN